MKKEKLMTKREVWQYCSCPCHKCFCEICEHDDKWNYEKGYTVGFIRGRKK